jgi:RNA polymerase sigma factor (sigma-70 family)
MATETLILSELKKVQPEQSGEQPSEQLIAKEVRDFIAAAVDRLTPQQRLVFLMSREKGLKQREIAEELGLSIRTVKKHMVDALRFLREEVGNTYGPYAAAIYILYHLG